MRNAKTMLGTRYRTSSIVLLGVIVDVVAKVLGSGKVKIAIDGQISSFKATSTGVSGSPTLIKRQVKTTITVSDGEVLLLGGFERQPVFAHILGAYIPSLHRGRSHLKTARKQNSSWSYLRGPITKHSP